MRTRQGGTRVVGLCLAGLLLAGQHLWADDSLGEADAELQSADESGFTLTTLEVGGKHVKVFSANQQQTEPETLAPGPPVPPADESTFEPGAGSDDAPGIAEGPAEHECEGPGWYDEIGCPISEIWVRNEYLHWFTTGTDTPPLVTTGPAVDPAGTLGDPDTVILVGDTELNDGDRSGYRLTLGMWLDGCRQFGIYGDFFDLGTQGTNVSLRSNGFPVLARPFIDFADPEDPISSSELIAFPGVIAGIVRVDAQDVFRGAGFGLRHNLCCESYCFRRTSCEGDDCTAKHLSYRLDGIVAYRHYHLGDRLTVRENLILVDAGGADPLGTAIDVTDRWGTTNDFHGVDLGGVMELHRGHWTLEVTGKVAVGNDRQSLTINGQTDVTVPGDLPVRNVGGLLALNNIGRYTRDDFAAIPQVDLTLSCQISCRLRAFAGYSFLYWANVLRAGEQVDLFIDSTQLPPGDPPGTQPQPGTQPPALFDSNFWAHGVNVGLEYRF